MRLEQVSQSKTMLQNQLEMLRAIFDMGFPNVLLLTKLDNQNSFDSLFALDWAEDVLEVVMLVFSNEDRNRLFMSDHLGIDVNNDNEDIQRHKYSAWLNSDPNQQGFLHNVIASSYYINIEMVEWVVQLLGALGQILQTDMRLLLEGSTAMICVVGCVNKLCAFETISKSGKEEQKG